MGFEKAPTIRDPSLTNLVAIVLGSLLGLFLGEPAGKLEIVGTIWVTLLQMTVLPYVLFSVIAAIGSP